MKYSFFNDYSTGAHPEVLNAVSELNGEREQGYGVDSFSDEARALLCEKLGSKNIDIHFVSNGTQANTAVLSSILHSYEAVITPVSGHTNVHESGAIEATGHKIINVVTPDGKLTPDMILEIVGAHNDEHMVKPKIVAIANATELGTIYSKNELIELRDVCRKNNLYLYLDGARLGQAIVSEPANLKLSDLVELADAFYIGGTKNGALMGEAIVLVNNDFKKNFRNVLKQRGCLLAKGKILGIQFNALFKNDLYLKLAESSKEMASRLRIGISEMGYKFLTDSTTNQLFPILPNHKIEKLKEGYGFYVWTKINSEESAIRLVTSWDTSAEAIEEFLSDLKALSDK